MLKFESLANIGDVIKAYDFKPMTGRDDVFLTGRIIDKGACYQELPSGKKVYLCEGYTVKVIGGDAESMEMGRMGVITFVPFEVDFMEYDERIQMVCTSEEFELAMIGEEN